MNMAPNDAAPPMAAARPEDASIRTTLPTATDQAHADSIVAQNCPIKRDLPRILQNIKALGAEAGERWVYRIPFKQRDREGNEKTVFVEGPTIKCAMAIATAYGNCRVEAFPAVDTPTEWIFMARFTDFETGFTLVRSFKQRKAQKTGMERKDPGRAEDMVYQIGQSKALRNVITDAMETVCDVAVIAAKGSTLGKIRKNEAGWRQQIVDGAGRLGIEVERIERTIATKAPDWTPEQMAKLVVEMSNIHDGLATVDDFYPELDTDESDDANAQAKAEQADDKKKGGGKKGGTKKQTAKKPDPEPTPEPEPEPEQPTEEEPTGDEPEKEAAEDAPPDAEEEAAEEPPAEEEKPAAPPPADDPASLAFGD